MRALLTLALLAAMPVAAQMPMQPPGKPDPKLATGGTYAVEPNHTVVRFSILHQGFNPYGGTFSKVSGSLMLDPRNLAATRLSIEVPIDSVHTTSDKLNEELVSKPFLDAGAYPTMTFVSTSVKASGTHATITGNLTLHGVTRPITLDAAFVGAGVARGKETVGFTATGTIKRSDFGVTFALPMISDATQIDITAAFEKAAG